MIEVLNECVDCGQPCMGSECPYRNVVRITCDKCGEEEEEIFHYDGKHFCIECIKEDLGLEEVVAYED